MKSCREVRDEGLLLPETDSDSKKCFSACVRMCACVRVNTISTVLSSKIYNF